MADIAAPPPVSGRSDLRLLSLQRQKAVRRLHDRTRNARLALAGAAALVVLVGIGIHSAWMPAGSGARPESVATPHDARSREFASTHVGHILLPAGNEETCRELEFHNDTGRFGQGRTVRCQDAIAGIIDPLTADANGRASSIRGFFSKP